MEIRNKLTCFRKINCISEFFLLRIIEFIMKIKIYSLIFEKNILMSMKSRET